MPSYVVRLWLPDRPGALGQVASRIGAVRGDVVGIDILERGGGRAIDELIVELPDTALVDLLVNEISQADGVDVEDVRPVADSLRDPGLDALETAAELVGACDVATLLDSLVTQASRVVGAAWAVAIHLESGGVASVRGPAPAAAWLCAFLDGCHHSPHARRGDAGLDDIVWAPLPSARLAVVLGRTATPFRARERQQIAALARIADTRLVDLERSRSRGDHPSVRCS